MTSPRGADRSKLDEIFGTELPRESSDDADRDADHREQWLRENVPPHHI